MAARRTRPVMADLPEALRGDIERAGYYPALVADVVSTALAGEDVVAHLVHQETTFDSEEVRRHVTVMAVTTSRLVVAHADDHGADDHGADGDVSQPYAVASTEAVPLHHVRSVVLSHVVTHPETYRTGSPPGEVTLTVCWGAVQRADLQPAMCADPDCEADHGYTGTLTSDDIVVRISADAEGHGAVTAALAFARVLSASTGPSASTAQGTPAP